MVMLLTMAMVFGSQSGYAGHAIDHSMFTELLSLYVHDGSVNYGKMKDDPRLGDYLAELAKVNPDSITDTRSRLAFWINIYNATTLKLICDNYPVESINDLHTGGLIIGTVIKATAWDKGIVKIKGKDLTLNEVEHKIIRPQFKDPRAHFALVCASKSCPQLRNEAYEGSRLEEQLDDQARRFLSDPFRNEFEAGLRKASMSKIFSWYGSDFGGSRKGILLRLANYLAPSVKESILADPTAWEVEYKDYDWSLNGH